MTSIETKLFQNLFDISAQAYGTAEGLVHIAFANNIGITDTLSAGTKLNIPDFENANKKVLRHYKENTVIPSTTQLTSDIEAIVAIDDVDDSGDLAPVFSREYTFEYKSEFGTQII